MAECAFCAPIYSLNSGAQHQNKLFTPAHDIEMYLFKLGLVNTLPNNICLRSLRNGNKNEHQVEKWNKKFPASAVERDAAFFAIRRRRKQFNLHGDAHEFAMSQETSKKSKKSETVAVFRDSLMSGQGKFIK